MEDKTKVFVVTYWDKEQEPVVTVFVDREAAEKCLAYFVPRHYGCCLDECPLYSEFRQFGN